MTSDANDYYLPDEIHTLKQLKRVAVSIKKAEGIKHFRALDEAAAEYGHSDYASAKAALSQDFILIHNDLAEDETP